MVQCVSGPIVSPSVGPSKYFEFLENLVSQPWDLIETWGFREDNNKDDTNHKGISAWGLDRGLGFSRGHQGRHGHRPRDDDGDDEEDNQVEDDDKDNDNNKDDNNHKGISALGLGRDLGFSHG